MVPFSASSLLLVACLIACSMAAPFFLVFCVAWLHFFFYVSFGCCVVSCPCMPWLFFLFCFVLFKYTVLSGVACLGAGFFLSLFLFSSSLIVNFC